MKNLLKKILKLFPPLYRLIKGLKLLYHKDSYLNTSGYMQSIAQEKPLDSDNNSIPWMNFNVVNFLKERLSKEMNLFEYGSGFSTEFYAKKVDNVVSIEHDEIWFDIISKQVASNCVLKYKKYSVHQRGGEYSKAILDDNIKYSVIVVDGRDRVNCIKNSISSLKDDGVCILDDSSRENYKSAFEFMEKGGFKKITFCGLQSTGLKENCTTVFYRDGNCFGI
jgi:precorrin-6B methylase 2